MKHAERVTPIAAVTSALATLLCCLPIAPLYSRYGETVYLWRDKVRSSRP